MIENEENVSELINEAIEESSEFEKLMDSTDFESWFESDDSNVLKKFEQGINPLNEFKKNKKKLERICCRMRKKGTSELPESRNKSSLDKYLVYKLFESKSKRVEARVNFNRGGYEEARSNLSSVSDILQNSKEDINDKRWMLLVYNDLSICWAGLGNSSISRGYAEEAIKVVKNEKSYVQFGKRLNAGNSNNGADIRNCCFVSSKLYYLYTVALFNQAVAEKRSTLYTAAERNFRKIIEYAEKDTHLLNLNYYSTLLNLGDLYIDLGRGNEAIRLLDKAIDRNKLDEDDIRYWNVYLSKINALIDQSEYGEAERLLEKLKKKTEDFILLKKHRVTSTGFKGLNCYARCKIEKAKNNLKTNNKEKKEKRYDELEKVEKIIKDNIGLAIERKQEGSEIKAYKQLSEIYEIYCKNKIARKYLIKFISNGEIDDLVVFSSHKGMSSWINRCDDLDALETLINQTIKVMENEPNNVGRYRDLLKRAKEQAVKECEDKDQLARAERIVEKIDEAERKKKDYNFLSESKSLNESLSDGKGLEEENIRKRLDVNEKDFDKVLFNRSKLKGDDYIVEVVVLKRWNSFSPGLFRESTGSLGGGYLLRIKRNSYLFSFSDIAKAKGKQKLLDRLHELGHLDLAKIMKDAKYSEDGRKIRISRNNKRIAALWIEKGSCYLQWRGRELRIGVIKEKGDKTNVYSGDPDVENIVIDPGHNFLQNFRMEGFYINDIDTIIVTHSHLDHCADLLSIMDLVYQFNKRYKDTSNKKRQRKKVNLCLSRGAYHKFLSYIDEPDWKTQLKDVIILENLENRKWEPFRGLTILAIPTPHRDLGGEKAIGLKIEIGGVQEENLCLGFTGDTPWYPGIIEDFRGCDLLCVHLGSIKYQEIGFTERRYEEGTKRKIEGREKFLKKLLETYIESNHLLFFGTRNVIENCNEKGKNTLIIVGEFGEELKYGLRKDLCERFSSSTTAFCIPGDIGLYVGIGKDGEKKVRCNFCEEFVPQEEDIATFSYGREDAIHYICETCDKTLSELQKQAIIEHRLTKH